MPLDNMSIESKTVDVSLNFKAIAEECYASIRAFVSDDLPEFNKLSDLQKNSIYNSAIRNIKKSLVVNCRSEEI